MSEKNRNIQRINTIFALKEWSDRDPNVAWFQIGGIHYDPMPKIQVTHATQQRIYAAANFYLSRQEHSDYDRAWNDLLDFTKLGRKLYEYNPVFATERLKFSRTLVYAQVSEELENLKFPGEKP